MLINFICRGNAYRSIMAEAYLNSLQLKNIKAISSGIVAKVNSEKNKPAIKRTSVLLRQHGIGAYDKAHWNQLTQQRLDLGNMTICMNKRIYDECSQLFSMPPKTITWDIADTDEGQKVLKTTEDLSQHAEYTYKKITEQVDQLVTQLQDGR